MARWTWLGLVLIGLVACASPPRNTVLPRTDPPPRGATKPSTPPPPVDVERARVVVDTARRYLGVPYRYGGDDVRGIDCSGLVVRAFDAAGVDLPRTAAAQAAAGYHVASRELRSGDLVLFATGGEIGHVGIWIGDGRFIHASTSEGVVEEDLRTRWFADRFVGGRRILRR